MKDWKTPEIKDLEISATEHQGGNGHNNNQGGCFVPVFSGATSGDVDWDDNNHQGDGKHHGHGGKH